METLIDTDSLRKILQRGLVAGYWSISQFNKTSNERVVIPDWAFLDEHPQFTDMDYRDIAAFREHQTNSPII